MSSTTTVPPATSGTSDIPRSSALGYVVAVATAALLADAVIETLATGSSVRTSALAAAGLYVLITAATWRARIGWRGRVSIALPILLGLVAVTAWLPAGLIAGIRFFGQSTPRILAAVVALGLAAAGSAILGARRMPLIARIALAALAAYGAVAFAAGAIASTPLAALLAGPSVWRRLPAILQGAFVGGVIVLPLGLVIAIARAGLRRPPASSAH